MSKYCPSCGGALAKAARYCNHCGADVADLPQKPAAGPRDVSDAKRREDSADALTYVAVGANITLLGLALGGLMALKEEGFSLWFMIAYLTLCAVALVVTDAIIFWRMTRLNPRPARPSARGTTDTLDTKELDAAHARSLPEHAPVPSVTEDATRNFEPAYRKRETT